MDMKADAAIDRRGGIAPLDHLVRLGLVIYLSPVILVVLAIGLIGLLAAKIGKPAAPVTVEGFHSHRPVSSHETRKWNKGV
jgi:hypothetical protein